MGGEGTSAIHFLKYEHLQEEKYFFFCCWGKKDCFDRYSYLLHPEALLMCINCPAPGMRMNYLFCTFWRMLFFSDIPFFGKARLSSTKPAINTVISNTFLIWERSQCLFKKPKQVFRIWKEKENPKPHKPYNKFSTMMWYIICSEKKGTRGTWSKRKWSDTALSQTGHK